MVNIVSPTTLPDPTGMAGILAAIANGNMFRDMSGLAATVALARSGLETTSDAAGRAGAQAGANLVTAAQKEVEMAKTAVAAMQTMMGNSNAQSGSGANISQQGAMINHGRTMDARGVPAGGGAGGGAGGMPAIGGGGTPASAGGTPAGGDARPGAGGTTSSPRSHEADATRAMVWPQLGEAPADFFQNAVDRAGDGATPTGPGRVRNPRYVTIHGLVTTGNSFFGGTALGVNPGGAFNNAVDIAALNTDGLFAMDDHQPTHAAYRWRQTASQKSFEKVAGTWRQVFRTIGSEPDDPDPLLQAQNRPHWLRTFDSPGWPVLVGPTTARLALGGGKTSDANATEVVVKMFLQTWIEGRLADGTWEDVTAQVLEWCSTQWLKRAAPAANWAPTAGSSLVEGAKALAEYGKNPDDVNL